MMTLFIQLFLTVNRTRRPISILGEASVFDRPDDVAGNSIPVNCARLLGDRTHGKGNHPVAGSGQMTGHMEKQPYMELELWQASVFKDRCCCDSKFKVLSRKIYARRNEYMYMT